MKICYLSENPLHLGKIMDYFSSRGHEVSYITFKENSRDNIGNYHLWEPIPRCYLTYFLNLYHIKNFLKEIKPDIIHAYYLTNFGFLGAYSGFKPFVVSAVGSDALINPFKSESKKRIFTAFINGIVRYVIKKADIVISMATHMNENLLQLGATPEKIRILTEGIDLEKYNILEMPQRNEDVIRVISTRQFENVYNLGLLIDAIPIVTKEYPNIEFVMIGEGTLKEKIITKVKEIGISDFVSFEGFINNDDIPNYLKSSDIYASASLSDGCSVSLLEAMACGAFPVVSNIPANRDLICDGVNGYLFDAKSSQNLAEKIILAVEKRELRNLSKIKNFEMIKSNFEMNLIMDQLLNIYKQLSHQK
ncbi:glycosyltransferase family 4 protein [bacterium]|nr:glycosyltransferase family 4 protein [bacterium]